MPIQYLLSGPILLFAVNARSQRVGAVTSHQGRECQAAALTCDRGRHDVVRQIAIQFANMEFFQNRGSSFYLCTMIR